MSEGEPLPPEEPAKPKGRIVGVIAPDDTTRQQIIEELGLTPQGPPKAFSRKDHIDNPPPPSLASPSKVEAVIAPTLPSLERAVKRVNLLPPKEEEIDIVKYQGGKSVLTWRKKPKK